MDLRKAPRHCGRGTIRIPLSGAVSCGLLLADRRDDVFRTEVRDADGGEEFAQRVFALETDVLDAEPFLFAEGVEVLHRQEADVRRIVPLVGQFLRLGHATVEHEASAGSPVAEIRERDDGLFRDAQQFVQERHGVADFLNRAVDNRVVETIVLEVRDAAVVEVALDDLHVLLDAVQDSGDVLFDAEPGRLLLVGEVV